MILPPIGSTGGSIQVKTSRTWSSPVAAAACCLPRISDRIRSVSSSNRQRTGNRHWYASARGRSLDLSPDGRELWAAHTGDGGVSIVDVSAGKVIQTIDAGTRRANRLKFTPDGRRVLISDMDGGALTVIDAQSRRLLNRLPVGRMPEGILITPDGTRAYVAVTGDNRVSVVDLSTLRITQSIETGNGPDGMAWVSLQ